MRYEWTDKLIKKLVLYTISKKNAEKSYEMAQKKFYRFLEAKNGVCSKESGRIAAASCPV